MDTIVLVEEQKEFATHEPLPPAPDWLMDNIAEASRTASQIYTLYLGILAYCAITIVTISDRKIILNESAQLPIIGLDVSVVGFFLLAPLIAMSTFVYLQLYLHKIKALIRDLNEYAPVKRGRLFPWMVVIAEYPESGTMGKIQTGIVAFSLWWSPPIIMFLFPLWFARTHEPFLC